MATITITPGNSFTPNQTVTSTRLNDLGSPTAALTAASIGTADIADDAITPALIADDAITTASIADDAITTALIADDAVTTALIADDAITTALIADDAVTSALIADDAITSALIADDAVTTPAILDANVTFAKLTDVIDSDTMTGASATTLATSESIKAYVDSLLQYQMKYSGATGTFSSSSSFADLDLSGIVGSNRAMVVMEVFDASSADNIFFRTKGSLVIDYPSSNNAGWGASATTVSVSNNGGTIILITDSSGIIEHQSDSAVSGINYIVQAFQKLA